MQRWGRRAVLGRTPTTTLLERVEDHIDRLDRTLKDSEDLLLALRRGDRGDWIRLLHQRLAGEPALEAAETPSDEARQPFYRS
jgi:hypothetical protein